MSHNFSNVLKSKFIIKYLSKKKNTLLDVIITHFNESIIIFTNKGDISTT